MWETVKGLPRPIQAAFIVLAVVAVVGIGVSISVSNDHEAALAAWERERGDLNERAAGLGADKEGLGATVAQQAAKIAELEGANSGLLKAHSSLAAIEAEAAASKGKLAGLSEQIVVSESQLKVVGSRLAVNQTSLLRAINRRDQAAKDFEDMKLGRARLGKVRQEVHTKEAELAMLGRRLAIGHQSLQKVLARRQEGEENAADLQVQRAALDQIGAELKTKQDQTKALARRLAASQVALDGALTRLGKAGEANRALKVQNDWLAQVVADTDAKEQRLKVIGQRLASSHASLVRAVEKRDQVLAETRALQAKLSGVVRGLEPLQQQIATWEQDVQNLTDLVGDAQGRLGEALLF